MVISPDDAFLQYQQKSQTKVISPDDAWNNFYKKTPTKNIEQPIARDTIEQPIEQPNPLDEDIYTPQYNENMQIGSRTKQEIGRPLDMSAVEGLQNISDKQTQPADIMPQFNPGEIDITPTEPALPQEQISSPERPGESFAEVGLENIQKAKDFFSEANKQKNLALDKGREKTIARRENWTADYAVEGFIDSLLRMPEEDRIKVQGTFGKIGYFIGSTAESIGEFALIHKAIPSLPMVQKIPLVGNWVASTIRDVGAFAGKMLVDELAKSDPSIQGYKDQFKEASPYMLAFMGGSLAGLKYTTKPEDITILKNLIGRGYKFSTGATIAFAESMRQGKTFKESIEAGILAGGLVAITGPKRSMDISFSAKKKLLSQSQPKTDLPLAAQRPVVQPTSEATMAQGMTPIQSPIREFIKGSPPKEALIMAEAQQVKQELQVAMKNNDIKAIRKAQNSLEKLAAEHEEIYAPKEEAQVDSQTSKPTPPVESIKKKEEIPAPKQVKDSEAKVLEEGKALKYDSNIVKNIRLEVEAGKVEKGNIIRDKAGNVIDRYGASSTFPEYFKRKGYNKKDTINLIDKYLSGQELTDKQSGILEDLYYSSGYPTLHTDAVKQLKVDLQQFGKNGFEMLSEMSDVEIDDYLFESELNDILTKEDFKNAIQEIKTKPKERTVVVESEADFKLKPKTDIEEKAEAQKATQKKSKIDLEKKIEKKFSPQQEAKTKLFDTTQEGETMELFADMPSATDAREQNRKRSEQAADEQGIPPEIEPRWTKDLPETRYRMESPEAVMLARDLGADFRVMKQMGQARGRFRPSGLKIDILASLSEDPGQAAKTISHEIGHFIDYLPKSMPKGNILSHVANMKNYLKQFIKEHPGSKEKLITTKEKDRMRKEAAEYFKNMDKLKVQEIVEETIYDSVGISANDIKDVFRGMQKRSKDLESYIGLLSEADKKSLLRASMKGTVPESIMRRYKGRKAVGVKKTIIEKEIPVDKELILKRFKRNLENEIRKRALLDNKIIRAEAFELSKLWRPYVEGMDPAYDKYRNHPTEIYADAVSVLFNDPELLKQEAPMFYRMFENYITARPGFQAEYEKYQELIKGGMPGVVKNRLEDQLDMFGNRGIEKHKELAAAEKEASRKNFSLYETLGKVLVDRTFDVKRMAKKANRPDVIADINAMNHLISESKGILLEIDRDVTQPLNEAGIERKYFDAYLFNNRILGDRAKLFNPTATDTQVAKDSINEIKSRLGEENFDVLVKAAKTFYKIQQKNFVDKVIDAQVYTPEINKILKETPSYVTFVPLKYLDDIFGKTISSKISEQYGTLSDIDSPFYQTILKGMAMNRAANKKIIVKNTIDFLKAYDGQVYNAVKRSEGKIQKFVDPMKLNIKDRPKGMDPRQYTLVTYPHDGVAQGFYIRNDVATALKFNNYNIPEALRGTVSFLKTLTEFSRNMFVSKNPAWMIRNVSKDIRQSILNLPEGEILGVLSNVLKGLPDVYNLVFKDIASDEIAEAFKIKALPAYRQYSGKEITDIDQYDQLVEKYIYGVPPKNALSMFLGFLDKLGEMSEKITKFGGYKFIKEKFPNISDNMLADLTRRKAGSPDFKVQSEASPALNQVFLFSQAAVNGYAETIDSAKKNPYGYAWNMFLMNIPKIMKWMAVLGLLGEGAKKLYGKYNKSELDNYDIIPLNAEGARLILPSDYSSQIVDKLMMAAIRKDPEKAEVMVKTLLELSPYGSMNPWLTVVGESIQVMSGINPKDPYTGNDIIGNDQFKAGFMERMGPLAVRNLKTLGSDIVYNPRHDVKVPFLGNVVNSFYRKGDYGLVEQEKTVKKGIEKESAILRVAARKAIQDLKAQVKKKKDYTPQDLVHDASGMTMALYKKGLINEKQISNYLTSIMLELAGAYTGDSSMEKIAKMAYQSKKHRESIMKKHKLTGKLLIDAIIIMEKGGKKQASKD